MPAADTFRLEENVADDVRGAEILQKTHVESAELGRLAQLPPFRPVVITLLRLFDRSDVSLDEVSALVEADPSTASEMLAVVNSPLFGVQQQVLQAAHGIALLGIDRTKSLAAALAMRSLMQGSPRTAVVRRFWMHSIATATIARCLAPAFQVPAEVSYMTALLHDLGRHGLLAAYPEEYSRLAVAAHENTGQILAEEQKAFGMTHCQAGEKLAVAWGLPAPFQEVARYHHENAAGRADVELVELCCRLADDLMFQSIHRTDIRKPEETVTELAPEHLHDRINNELDSIRQAIDSAINSFDF